MAELRDSEPFVILAGADGLSFRRLRPPAARRSGGDRHMICIREIGPAAPQRGCWILTSDVCYRTELIIGLPSYMLQLYTTPKFETVCALGGDRRALSLGATRSTMRCTDRAASVG